MFTNVRWNEKTDVIIGLFANLRWNEKTDDIIVCLAMLDEMKRQTS